jgi:hypothetical protein
MVAPLVKADAYSPAMVKAIDCTACAHAAGTIERRDLLRY